MKRGNILPIAVIAFALVGFLFVMDYSMNTTGKWPWSTTTNITNTNNTNVPTTSNANVSDATTDDWKTYTDPNNMFTAKFPATYTAERCPDGVVNFSVMPSGASSLCEGMYQGIYIEPRKETTIEGAVATLTPSVYPTTNTTTTLDGLTATRLQWTETSAMGGPSRTWEIYLVKTTNGVFGIVNSNSEQDPLFTHFLPTVHFLSTVAASTADWKTYTNYKYGYTIKYPKTLDGPYSTCGGEGLAYNEAVDVCGDVYLTSEPDLSSTLASGITFEVFDNTDKIPLKTFVQDVLVRATIVTPVTAKLVGSATTYTAVFTGALRSWPGTEGGFFDQAQTFVQYVPIGNNQILRILYPKEFCFVIKTDTNTNRPVQHTTPCSSDARNTLYGQIVNTFTLVTPGSDWKTYTNPAIGLSFSYPPSWGTVQVQAVDSTMNVNQTGALVNKGRAIFLSFSNGGPHLQASSSDFSQFMGTGYTGGKKLTKSCKYPNQVEQSSYCTLITVAGQPTADTMSYDAPECSPNYTRQVDLNLTHGTYAGLTVGIGFPSNVSCTASNADTQRVISSELATLYTRKDLDAKTLQGLRDFDTLLANITLTK